jgi:formylglycine-generating enzyme required for sulfatase activity
MGRRIRPPSHFSRTGDGKDAVKDIPDAELKRFPVENVSWDDTQLFLARLNERAREAGWVYRLPTEAEWEYACRGGPLAAQIESTFWYDSYQPLNRLLLELGNFKDETKPNRPCKVGSYPPNRLGLYDMHGNVGEWCDDTVVEGKGAAQRVNRGGSWFIGSHGCRAVDRYVRAPSFCSDRLGLRVARVPAGKGGK